MASDWQFQTEVEVEFDTDRYDKVNGPNGYAEYESKSSTHLNWELLVDARNWGLKDLTFVNKTPNITLEVDYQVDTPKKDEYGFEIQETKTDVINIPLNNDNIEKIYTHGYGFHPYKVEIEESNGQFEVKIYIATPGGIETESSLKNNIKLSMREDKIAYRPFRPFRRRFRGTDAPFRGDEPISHDELKPNQRYCKHDFESFWDSRGKSISECKKCGLKIEDR